MARNRSFKTVRLFMLGALLAIGNVCAHAEQKPLTVSAQVGSPPLEQKALDLLTESSDRLAASGTLSFQTVVTDELSNFPGPPLRSQTISDVVMQRPDKLRVITSGAGSFSEFYYDGRMITEFSPSTNFATATTAPPTIGEALRAAYNSAAIYFPFTAIVMAEPYQNWGDCLLNAVYVGQRVVDGTTTDLIAYATNRMSVQLWIGAEDRLPRMVLSVFRDDPLQLRHQLEFSNWQIDPPVSAEAFNVNSAILARTEPIFPLGLPVMNTPTAPAR